MSAPDLDELERAVAADLAAERGALAWLRQQARGVRLLLVIALVAADAAFFHTFMLRRDFAELPRARFALTVGGFVLIVLVAAWQALRPLYRPPAPAWALRGVLAVALLVPLVVALAPGLPHAHDDAGFDHVSHAWYCFSAGIAQGLALVLLLRALDRGGRGAGDEALLVAVAGGVLGQIGLSFECPVNFPLHLLAGHASVPLGLLLGALLWRRAAR